MPTVTLYTRDGCGLCEQARQTLLEARRRVPFTLDVVDIDQDPGLQRLYTIDVPVIAIDGEKAFQHSLALDEFLARLDNRT